MILLKKALPLVFLIIVSACQTIKPGGQPDTGTSFGGGIAKKSAFDGLKDGPLSQSLGEGLNASQKKQALNAELTALETGLAGSATPWGENSGVSGRVIPGQVYEVGESKCRRYTHEIVVNGTKRQGVGTACKEQNGLWMTLN